MHRPQVSPTRALPLNGPGRIVRVDIEKALRSRGGAARWKELDALGFSKSALAQAVRTGRIDRVHRGCYALRDAHRATVMATVFRAQPTCVSWCERAGLPLEGVPITVHLGVPQSRGIGEPRARPIAGVTLHRHGAYGDEFPLAHLDLVALCTTPIAQLALIDAALARGIVAQSELAELQHGEQRRRDWLREHADARSGSLAETYARVALTEAGLRVVPQARIGAIGCVDLLVEGTVAVEVDGYAHHCDRRHFASDRLRDRDVTLAGLVPLRFTYHDVVTRTSDLVADVSAAVWRAGAGSADRASIGDVDPPARASLATLRTRMNDAARVSSAQWWR